MKVVIVGGTHGNEKTGVFLLQKYQQNPRSLPQNHQYFFCLGNPKAVARNQRYVDFDLNRAFNSKTITDSDYEYQRSLEIKKEVLDWAQSEPFFLIDLHTTTANMGDSIVLSKTDKFSAHVADEVLESHPSARLLFNTAPEKGRCFVESIAPHGLLIEVGPVAQNTYNPVVIENTEQLLLKIINALSHLESKNSLAPIVLEGYDEGAGVPFPLDERGNPSAYLHPDFFGKDYCPLKKGNPIFLDRDHRPINYEKDETIYPLFIGEAAYLGSHTAFICSQKQKKKFS